MAADKAAGRVLLPDTVIPHRYELTLSPDLERFVFDGSAKIHVDVNEATSDVVLHAKELQISTATFQPKDGQEIALAAVSYNIKDMTVTLTFDEVLPVGPGAVSIDFVGCLNNQMAGFYRSCYKDINGETKVMASTQFESLDARRAFPCWDEPARKAVFAVTLVVDEGLAAFSNMPEKSSRSTTVGKKRKREIAFMDSPKMSTYLVAFVVGEVDFVQAKTEHGVLVRVYTPPGRSEAGQFALDVARKCLDLYDDFFGVPYPLPKLDMVAISEFAMGAMENWGLVTYREVDLLIDQKTASNQQKQRVAIVVTHELAHQWFGNLVTMAWWDDLWLNEGFASWCENYAADVIFPDYGFWEQFAADTLAAALRLDALKTSHAIQVPIKRAEEVEEVFDAISYCKGASVVKMLHAVIGKEHFQAGLQLYMERHQYSNTETFHLWRAWEEVSGQPIGQMMATWTEQMGFPLLEVKARTAEGDSVTLDVTQKWFLADGSEPEGDAKLWTIPLLVSSATQAGSLSSLMTDASGSVTVGVSSAAPWAKLNAGQHVPMRVSYDAASFAALRQAVASQEAALGPEDRAGLLLDAFALAKAGHSSVPPGALLELLAAYANETNSVVWEAMEGVMVGLDKLLLAAPADSPAAPLREMFQAYCARLVAPAAAMIGWTDDEAQDATVAAGHLGKLLRATIVRLQAKFAAGDPSVAGKARTMFDRYLEDPSSPDALPSDLKISVFKIVLQSGGEAEFNQLMALLDTLSNNAEKKQIYNAIGSAATPALKQRVLDWALAEVKLQDFFYPIGSVSQSSPEGLELAWSFYQANFDTFKSKLAQASASLMDAAIVYSVSGFATAEKAAEVEAFFVAHPLPQSARKIAQTVENMRTSATFLDTLVGEHATIRTFLEGAIN